MSALKGNLDVAAVGLALALAEQAHQTRHTRDRGRLLVHAAKKLVKDVDAELAVENEFGSRWQMDLPTGAIIGW
jgi:hypothetical protein